MARLTKKQKEAMAKIEKSKFYSLNEALRKIHKDNDTCKIENFAEVSSTNNILYWVPILIFGIILLLQIYKIKNNQ